MGTAVVEPHLVWRRTHVAKRWEADVGIVGGDQYIAIERQVGAPGQAMTVDLGDRRLVHVPECAQLSLNALEVPGVFVDSTAGAAFDLIVAIDSRRSQVVPGTKSRTIRAENHAVYRTVVVGFPQRVLEFLEHAGGECVSLFRLVEGDARTAALDFVEDVFVGLRLRHQGSPGVGQ